jgi:hypothetical protein
MNEPPSVFFAELDEDLQVELGLDAAQLKRRAYAYFLLADTISVHPAYLWQSSLSHDLILGPGGGLLRPPFVTLALGDSSDAEEYMSTRIEKLKCSPVGAGSRELAQYHRRLVEPRDELRTVDREFSPETGFHLGTSRDARFRRLLTEDLRAEPEAASLARLVAGAIRVDEEEAASRLRRFVADADLVSMDTVEDQIRRIGAGGPIPASIRKRVMSKYYLANIDHRFVVPGASGLAVNRAIDPLDADLFWAVFAKLFGDEAAARISTADEIELQVVLWKLREDEGWLDFRRQYFSLLDAIDETLLSDPDGVVADLRSFLRVSRLDVPRRLWREEKLPITSAVLSAALTAASPPGAVAMVAGAGIAGLLSFVDLGRSVRRFVAEYNSRPFQQLQASIRNEVAAAARRFATRRRREQGKA